MFLFLSFCCFLLFFLVTPLQNEWKLLMYPEKLLNFLWNVGWCYQTFLKYLRCANFDMSLGFEHTQIFILKGHWQFTHQVSPWKNQPLPFFQFPGTVVQTCTKDNVCLVKLINEILNLVDTTFSGPQYKNQSPCKSDITFCPLMKGLPLIQALILII